MKFAIFGDVHGNLEALEAVLEDFQIQGVTHTACTGDLVGQYANPRECLEIVRALGCRLVKGDQDERAAENFGVLASGDRKLLFGDDFRPSLTENQRDFLAGQPLQRLVDSFTLVHASLDQPNRWDLVLSPQEADRSFPYQETDLFFFGHTHVPHVFIRDTEVHEFFYRKIDVMPGKKYFINVGSVGEPRDGDWRAAYALYDSAANTVELRRVPFDLAKVRAKLGGSD